MLISAENMFWNKSVYTAGFTFQIKKKHGQLCVEGKVMYMINKHYWNALIRTM